MPTAFLAASRWSEPDGVHAASCMRPGANQALHCASACAFTIIEAGQWLADDLLQQPCRSYTRPAASMMVPVFPGCHAVRCKRAARRHTCSTEIRTLSAYRRASHSPSHQDAGLDAGSIACWKSLLPANGPACGIRSARACTPFRAAPDVMALATGTRRRINIRTATVCQGAEATATHR